MFRIIFNEFQLSEVWISVTNGRWQTLVLTAMAALYLTRETFFKNQSCHLSMEFSQFHWSVKSKLGIRYKELLKKKINKQTPK